MRFLDIIFLVILLGMNLTIILSAIIISKKILTEYEKSGSSFLAMNSSGCFEHVPLLIFLLSKPLLTYFVWRFIANNNEFFGHLETYLLLVTFFIILFFTFVLYLFYFRTILTIILHKTIRIVRKIETSLLEDIIHSFANMAFSWYYGLLPLIGTYFVQFFLDPINDALLTDNSVINIILVLMRFLVPMWIFYTISTYLSPNITAFLLKPKTVKNKNLKEMIKQLIESHNCANIQFFEYPSEKEKTANAFYVDKPNKKIMISDYLAKKLESEEIKAILLHEIAHAKQTPKSKNFTGSFLGSFALYLLGLGAYFITVIFLHNNIIVRMFEGISITLMISSTILSIYDLIFYVLNLLRISRTDEKEADEYVIKSGIKPRMYISALRKLYLLDDYPESLRTHEEKLSTHPSLENRIKYINEFAESMGK